MRQLNAILDDISRGNRLEGSEVHSIFSRVMRGELESLELAALLVALKVRGEHVQEISGAARALRDNARPFPRPDYVFADTCGTGGDGAGTINISTAAAFVAAAMGIPVAKHGNRSVSSRSGSADVLEACGVDIQLDAKQSRRNLDRFGICFLFAPDYHHGVRYAMAVRRGLKTRTMFNLLGPLVNPSRPGIQLVGVYDPRWVRPMAECLAELGCGKAMVVHGGGLDEIALHASTQAAFLCNGVIEEMTLKPGDFGVAEFPLAELQGADASTNASHMRAILAGRASAAQVAAVAVNAGALAWLAGKHASLSEGAEAAFDAMNEGRALEKLEQLKESGRDTD